MFLEVLRRVAEYLAWPGANGVAVIVGGVERVRVDEVGGGGDAGGVVVEDISSESLSLSRSMVLYFFLDVVRSLLTDIRGAGRCKFSLLLILVLLGCFMCRR